MTEKKRWCPPCQVSHPESEMKRVVRNGVVVWRCVKSLQGSKMTLEQREEFGRKTSELNKAARLGLKAYRGEKIKEGKTRKRLEQYAK